MAGSVPTIDDLRTKICYICREEEDAEIAAASAVWVHPCGACALVAHEECLLQWMRGAQQSDVHTAKALVCPQCGGAYDIESAGRRALALIRAGDRLLVAAGAATPVVAGFLAGITILASTCEIAARSGPGAHAVRRLGHLARRVRRVGPPHARRRRRVRLQIARALVAGGVRILPNRRGRDLQHVRRWPRRRAPRPRARARRARRRSSVVGRAESELAALAVYARTRAAARSLHIHHDMDAHGDARRR
jgi:hypothetical protein